MASLDVETIFEEPRGNLSAPPIFGDFQDHSRKNPRSWNSHSLSLRCQERDAGIIKAEAPFLGAEDSIYTREQWISSDFRNVQFNLFPIK